MAKMYKKVRPVERQEFTVNDLIIGASRLQSTSRSPGGYSYGWDASYQKELAEVVYGHLINRWGQSRTHDGLGEYAVSSLVNQLRAIAQVLETEVEF